MASTPSKANSAVKSEQKEDNTDSSPSINNKPSLYGVYELKSKAVPPPPPKFKMIVRLEKKANFARLCGFIGAAVAVILAIATFFLVNILMGSIVTVPNIKSLNFTK